MFRYLRREIAENNQRIISLEKCSLFLGYIWCLLQLVGLKRLTFNWDYAWKRGHQLQLFQITSDLQCQKHLWILGFCDINQNLEAQCLSFPALCLVDWEDLFFDALLCDVNFSCFSSQVFLPSYWNKANFDSKVKTTANQIVLILSFQLQKIHGYGRLKTNQYKYSQ